MDRIAGWRRKAAASVDELAYELHLAWPARAVAWSIAAFGLFMLTLVPASLEGAVHPVRWGLFMGFAAFFILAFGAFAAGFGRELRLRRSEKTVERVWKLFRWERRVTDRWTDASRILLLRGTHVGAKGATAVVYDVWLGDAAGPRFELMPFPDPERARAVAKELMGFTDLPAEDCLDR